MRTLKLYEEIIHLEKFDEEPRYVKFEYAFPFTNIPMDDFDILADRINARYANGSSTICQKSPIGHCFMKQECN